MTDTAINTWPRRICFGNVSAFPISPWTLWRGATAGWQQKALTAASSLQGRGWREGHGQGPTLPKACPEHPKLYRGVQQEPKYCQKERRGFTANRTWITFPKRTSKRKKKKKKTSNLSDKENTDHRIRLAGTWQTPWPPQRVLQGRQSHRVGQENYHERCHKYRVFHLPHLGGVCKYSIRC